MTFTSILYFAVFNIHFIYFVWELLIVPNSLSTIELHGNGDSGNTGGNPTIMGMKSAGIGTTRMVLPQGWGRPFAVIPWKPAPIFI